MRIKIALVPMLVKQGAGDICKGKNTKDNAKECQRGYVNWTKKEFHEM